MLPSVDNVVISRRKF